MAIPYLSPEKFRLIVEGWLTLLVFLTFFWGALLRRFAEILQARQAAAGSRQAIPASVPGMLRFLLRAEYRKTGDGKLIAVCHRLRNLLFGYFGCASGFVVFVILMRPRF